MRIAYDEIERIDWNSHNVAISLKRSERIATFEDSRTIYIKLKRNVFFFDNEPLEFIENDQVVLTLTNCVHVTNDWSYIRGQYVNMEENKCLSI